MEMGGCKIVNVEIYATIAGGMYWRRMLARHEGELEATRCHWTEGPVAGFVDFVTLYWWRVCWKVSLYVDGYAKEALMPFSGANFT